MSDVPALPQAVVDRRFQEIMANELADPYEKIDSTQYNSERALEELDALSYSLSMPMQEFITYHMTHGELGDGMADTLATSGGEADEAEKRFARLFGEIEEETTRQVKSGYSADIIARNIVTAAYVDGLDDIVEKADALEAFLREFEEFNQYVDEADRSFIQAYFEKLTTRASFNRWSYHQAHSFVVDSPDS